MISHISLLFFGLLFSVPGEGAISSVAHRSAPPAAAAAHAQEVGNPLRPDTVIRLPDGRRIVLLRAADNPVAALRLSYRAEPGAVGWAQRQVMARWATERLRRATRATGLQARVRSSGDALVYTVEGPLVELEEMAHLLRTATRWETPEGLAFQQLREAVIEELDRVAETAAGRLRAEMDRTLRPGQPDPSALRRAVASLNRLDLRSGWEELHRPGRASLVAVGDLEPVEVMAAVATTGDREAEPPSTAAAVAPSDRPERRTQVLRRWLGRGWHLGEVREGAPLVSALLLGEVAADGDSRYEATVTLRTVSEGHLLIVTGAAYSGAVAPMRTLLDTLVERARTELDSATVERLRATARMRLLQAARTPGGRAEQVGSLLDLTDDATTAASLLDSVRRTDRAAVDAVFTEMAAGPDAVAEVRR